MAEEKRSKLADVERLRLIRYQTRGPGACRVAPSARPSIEKLRKDVAKVGKKKSAKKARKARR